MNKPLYLVVTPYFPTPTSWRGPFCYDFVRALKRTGKYDVVVFVPGDGVDYVYHDIKVFGFKYRSLPLGVCAGFLDGINGKNFLNKLTSVGINACDVAVCHSHEVFCLPLVCALKERNESMLVVQHFHAMGHPFHLSVPRIGVLPLYSTIEYLRGRRYLERVDLPVFVSRRQRNMFGKWYPNGFLGETEDIRKRLTFGHYLPDIVLRPSYVLYNGIDYSVFTKKGKQQCNQDFVIGDVANFSESKDQMTLLRAMTRICADKEMRSHVRCRLVGTGPMLAVCMNYVKKNNLEDVVEFITEMDHLKLPEFYQSLDLFVSPSWAEGFCCTFMEAHGCGATIMGCNGVSVDEVFTPDEREKWLFDPKDDSKLANMIIRYYQERSEQKFIADFDINELVNGFVKHLEGIRSK